MQFTSTLLVALLAVSSSPTLTTAQQVSNLRGGGHGVMGGGFTAHTATPPTRTLEEEEGCQIWEDRAIEKYQTCPAGQIMCHNPNTSQNMCRLIEGFVDNAADEKPHHHRHPRSTVVKFGKIVL